MTMNLRRFYDVVRRYMSLTPANVQGFDICLLYLEPVQPNVQQAAYEIATAYWETAATMQPVREAFWLSEAWRKRNLRYYPWYGRGLIQTTWERNYKKMSPVVGVDLLKNPNKLLEWKYALPAWHEGMERGLYTGKAMDDYIDEIDERDSKELLEYKNARRVVNGTDKASQIGQLALIFERALKTAGFGY